MCEGQFYCMCPSFANTLFMSAILHHLTYFQDSSPIPIGDTTQIPYTGEVISTLLLSCTHPPPQVTSWMTEGNLSCLETWDAWVGPRHSNTKSRSQCMEGWRAQTWQRKGGILWAIVWSVHQSFIASRTRSIYRTSHNIY